LPATDQKPSAAECWSARMTEANSTKQIDGLAPPADLSFLTQ
jgi:hypothetical protein